MKTIQKRAQDLQEGDVILEFFKDIVDEVHFIRDGKVHVYLLGGAMTRIYDEDELVTVLRENEND